MATSFLFCKTVKYSLIILCFSASFLSIGQKEFGLDAVFKSAPQIERLNISNEKLSDLPPEISNCKKLIELNLKNNRISKLPSWIATFSDLEVLDISGNRNLNIKDAFDIISKLPKLRVLKASGCKMLYLPISIREVKTLRIVDLSNNFIPYLPPILETLMWEELDLSTNCIDTLPSSMVYMTSLRKLNLSYCPAASNKHNYYMLEYLTNLKTLVLSGMDQIPNELGKVNFIEELILTNGTFKDLPDEIKNLKKLKHIDVRGCEQLNISDLIERISTASKKIKTLKIGHFSLNGLPYNMFKLKKLEAFYIDNSCINSLPTSFHKFKGKAITFRHCSFSTPEKVFKNLGKAKKLVNLEINSCVFGHNNWTLGTSLTLREINLINCGLVKIPLSPLEFPKLKKLNLIGNKIPQKAVTWEVPKTILGVNYNTILYSKKELKRWKYTSIRPGVKRMIYSEVGDVFVLKSGTQIEVKEMAFISTGNIGVTGDVELRIKEFYKTGDYLLSNYPTFLPTDEVANVKYSIEIRAYVDDKEVYLKSDKPIIVKPKFKKAMALDKYYYHKYKNEWETIEQQVDVCSKKKVQEVKAVCPNYADMPYEKNKLRVSKVHLRIKRNKRRNTLNFEIAPEYGYLENQLNIFGDRIKGYPELKTYKKVKWRYVGDSLDSDLERLYFLSESAKKEKMNRKSSFYFYVLDIKDIRIFPNPKDDNYLIQFIQGRDTFSVVALPFLPILKAKKIQRWHRRKYRKYRKALVKRKVKWIEMDTTYLYNYSLFENKLEEYRQVNLRSRYSLEPVEVGKNAGQVLKIYKPGLYALSIPLLINNGIVKKPIYYLNGKRFRPRRVLVSNLSKKYHFWTGAKEVVKEKGVYSMSIILNGIIYNGKWGKNNKVEFEKVELK
jgi:Leucine-rich repeat (LRR) protein